MTVGTPSSPGRPIQPRVRGSRSPGRAAIGAWIVGLGLVKLLLHLATNLWAGYGVFRDELYYLACADHLAWGYVDQPPLSIALLAAWRAVAGDSLFALRLPAAVAAAATVVVIGLIVRELGGGRAAVALAGLASLVSLIHLAFSTIYSMNAFDMLFWALAVWLLARILNGAGPRLWLALGVVLGLGLLNKVGVLWLGVGLAVGLLLTPERRRLATRWPWLAAGIALLLFSPYLLWNLTHDWAHLEFIGNAVAGKYSGLSVADFLVGQVMVHNPVTLPLWFSGLLFLLVLPAGRRWRLLGWIWLGAALVLLANGHSKAEYLSSAYAVTFAAGGVAWERWLGSRRWALGLGFGVLGMGAALAPITLPILPVESFVRYQETLGLEPSTAESKELAELPQFYADMFGWEAKARAVAEVYAALPAEERRRAVFFGRNYGQAGAIDYWRGRLELPPAISGHNSYWLWGPGDSRGEVVIVMGGSREDLEQRFESVEAAGVAACDYCMPYEKDLPIYVGRRLRVPIGELWSEVKNYS